MRSLAAEEGRLHQVFARRESPDWKHAPRLLVSRPLKSAPRIPVLLKKRLANVQDGQVPLLARQWWLSVAIEAFNASESSF